MLQFDGLGKVKVKYVVFSLDALAKFQNVRIASRRPAWIGNCWTYSHMSQPYQSS